MLFDLEKVGTLKREEMEAIATGYSQADTSIVLPEGGAKAFANKLELAQFIEEAAKSTEGFPHQVTEADYEANELYKTEEIKVGDFVILPWPTEDVTAREAMMADVEDLALELTEEERDTVLEIAGGLTLEELAPYINELRARVEALKGAGDGDTTKNDDEDEEEEETASEGNSDDVEVAIKSGKLRFENHLIIAVRPRIVSGRTKYELDATDGTSYLATKEELDAAIKSALA